MREGTALPPELTDIVICEAMGWSWSALMETPAEVVEDVRVYLAKKGLVAKERK